MNSWSTFFFKAPLIVILFIITNSMSGQPTNVNSDNKIRTVVIDPGHGGKDPGAIGKKGKEKDVVLAIGLKLGDYIEKNIPDVKVIYTRKTDEFIPLYKRAEIANKANADLFISLHANGSKSTKPYGTETLVLGLHRSNENFEVAKRENSVILMEEDHTVRYDNFDPESPESYIIFQYMVNIYDKHSVNFADYVQDQFLERAKRKDRGVKRQGLLVLAQTSMPGVLIETGFITNPTEEKYLMSDDGQSYIASAIYRAFKEYKKEFESKSLGGSNESIAETATEKTPTTNEEQNTVQKETQPAEIENETNGTEVQASVNESNTDQEEIKDKNRPRTAKNAKNIYFKVQVLSSSSSIPLDSAEFKEFNDVEEFKTDSNYKYAVGHKKTYDEIVVFSKLVKNRFPDAFIIAVQDGKIIPLQDARNMLN